MDLRNYLTALRRGWWLVVVFALLGAAVAGFQTYRETPIYAAKVTFYISIPSTNSSSALSSDQFAQDRANSYAQLLSSEQLGDMIAADTQLPLTGRQVAGTITGSAELNTVLVTATVKDASPQQALTIARSAANQFPKLVDQLDNKNSSVNVSLTPVSGPQVGDTPISPRKKLSIGLGLLAGLVIGLFAAAVRHLLDTSVRGVETLERIVRAPVLASVPLDAKTSTSPLVLDSGGTSPRGEAIRQLRTALQFADAASRVQVLVVSSAIEGEGKSTTAANLALVMAEAGRRTLLLDADLRRPRIADYLGLEGAVGLTNVLAEQTALEDALQLWGPDGLTVLTSGSIPPNPSELLSSPRMTDLLSLLRESFDVVVMDSPPLLPVTDAAVLSAEADGLVLVVRHGRTKRPQILASVRALRAVDARVLGVVVNMKPLRRADRQTYGVYAGAPAPAQPVPTTPVDSGPWLLPQDEAPEVPPVAPPMPRVSPPGTRRLRTPVRRRTRKAAAAEQQPVENTDGVQPPAESPADASAGRAGDHR